MTHPHIVSIGEEIERLQDELRVLKLEEQEQQWAWRRCRGCRELDAAQGGVRGYLSSFSMQVAQGEEGASIIDDYICDLCLGELQTMMVKLNLGIHAHGGICFLEQTDCPKAQDYDQSCLTPENQFDPEAEARL